MSRVQRKKLQEALSEPPKAQQGKLNWVQRYRQTSKVLGKVQLKLHKYLAQWQRLQAILTWKSPERTRVFLLAMVTVAVVLCLVPSRLLFVVFLLGQFSKPLRDNASGLYKLGLTRFVDGLPLPSLAAAVYAEKPGAALAAVPRGSVVQTLSSMQGEELTELGGEITEEGR
jgi:Flp pilus assembly protein TadB